MVVPLTDLAAIAAAAAINAMHELPLEYRNLPREVVLLLARHVHFRHWCHFHYAGLDLYTCEALAIAREAAAIRAGRCGDEALLEWSSFDVDGSDSDDTDEEEGSHDHPRKRLRVEPRLNARVYEARAGSVMPPVNGDGLFPEGEYEHTVTARRCHEHKREVEDVNGLMERRFHKYASEQLRNMCWDHVVAAGGCILACLRAEECLQCDTVDWGHYAHGDIDLFIVGVDRDTASAILQHITAVIVNALPSKVYVAKTNNAITFFRGWPLRCIQVNMGLHASQAQVLANFDLDCVAVAYDGQRVRSLPCFKRALEEEANVLKAAIGTVSYVRLEKYSERGFALHLPRAFAGPLTSERLDVLAALLKMACLREVANVKPPFVFNDDDSWPYHHLTAKSWERFWIAGITAQRLGRRPLFPPCDQAPYEFPVRDTALEMHYSGGLAIPFGQRLDGPLMKECFERAGFNIVVADSNETLSCEWREDDEALFEDWGGRMDPHMPLYTCTMLEGVAPLVSGEPVTLCGHSFLVTDSTLNEELRIEWFGKCDAPISHATPIVTCWFIPCDGAILDVGATFTPAAPLVTIPRAFGEWAGLTEVRLWVLELTVVD